MFTSCSMRNLRLREASLEGIDLDKCNFHSADYEGLVLEGHTFFDSRFDWEGGEVTFRGVEVENCDFTGRAWESLRIEGMGSFSDCRAGGKELEDC